MADEASLERFVEAQAANYPVALAEIRRGSKTSHWMWYVFPQLIGLGLSATARHFAIRSIDEARAYLRHPLLGPRYRECIAALQEIALKDPALVFGAVDAMKLRSSLTLFEAAAPEDRLCAMALDRWFDGARDRATIDLLRRAAAQ